MRRYSQAFLAVALFCFLFPFMVITPAKNSGALQMTGWEMLTTKNIGVSQQPPVVLHIPLRTPVLLALLAGAAGILVKLTKKKDVAWVGVAVTIIAAVSLCTVTASRQPVQLTDGQNTLYEFDNPPVQLLPAFYVSLCLMGAAVVSSLLNLQRQPAMQSARVGLRPLPAPVSLPASRPVSFCIKCGGGMAAGARFCNRCGSVAAAATPVSKPPAPAPVAPPVAKPEPVMTAAPAVAMASAVSSAPATAPIPPPAVAPAVEPLRVAFPRPVPGAVARSGFSAGAKLGFAAVALIFGIAIWLAFRPSDNQGASMSSTTVSISPAIIRVVPGGTARVMALVNGDNREVRWTIEEGASGGSVEPGGATVQNGTVFLLGNYHAPYLPGTYHVTAISAADQTRKATAQVVVGYGGPGRF